MNQIVRLLLILAAAAALAVAVYVLTGKKDPAWLRARFVGKPG